MDAAVSFKLTQLMGSGLTIRGINTGDSEPDVFIPQLIDLYRQGRMPFDKLMKTYRLEDINHAVHDQHDGKVRSEEHTSELQSLMRISYAVFCLKKKNKN